MGRLIDFDVCEKILTEFYESSLNDHDAMLFVEFMAQLENVPTAYDVEKVVAELENIKTGGDCRHKCKYYDWSVGTCEGHCEDYVREKAIEIVKCEVE